MWVIAAGLVGALLWAACSGSGSPSADAPHIAQLGPQTHGSPAAVAAIDTSTAPSAAAAAAAPDATPPASAEPAAAVSVPSADPPPVEQLKPVPLHPFLPAAGRQRVVVLDPGHGGPEVGAAGAGVAEKDANLKIAFKLKDLLERDGMRVVLTRDSDRRATSAVTAAQPAEYSATRLDVQARVDIANAAEGDVFISIHNNGSGSPADAGTEIWWDGKRPWAAYNRALAEQMLGSLLTAIRSTGYPVQSRGLKEDSLFRVRGDRAFPIFVLGPPRTGAQTTRATQMPAVLGETLFLSNPTEAQLLARDDVLQAIARGYREGLLRYFALIDTGVLTLPPGGLPPEVPNHYETLPPSPGR